MIEIGHDKNTPENYTQITTESDKTVLACQQKNESLRRV
jgi:hypothetical protein